MNSNQLSLTDHVEQHSGHKYDNVLIAEAFEPIRDHDEPNDNQEGHHNDSPYTEYKRSAHSSVLRKPSLQSSGIRLSRRSSIHLHLTYRFKFPIIGGLRTRSCIQCDSPEEIICT